MTTNFFSRMAARAALTAVLGLFAFNSRAQYTNGMYAEFNTTMGSFTCALYYAYAPKAVASFVGLANGQRAWLDLQTGLARTNPFYNSLTFHRVVTNFVIQAGSPNGNGTDGPGYSFVDEVTNALQFDRYGVLAMANSGPDSNGSQFFVTATNSLPGLNNGYTIFGRLFGGSNVVYAINHVATDSNNKPLTPVRINSVTIRRVGAAATAFDINAQGLPTVTNLNLKIELAGTNAALTFSNRLYADNRLYAATNFSDWTGNSLGIETAAPVSGADTQPKDGTATFFRLAQIQYPSSTFAPKSVYGKTVTLFYTSGIVATNRMVFDTSGGGSYTVTGFATTNIASYYWYQLPYNAQVPLIIFGGEVLPPMALKLNFKSSSGGKFNGTAYPYYPYSFLAYGVSGSFTNSP